MALRAGGLVAAAAVVALAFWAAGVPTADNPHAYMDSESRCTGCHRMEKDGSDWILDPHIFRSSVVAVCQGCHPPQRMGRSHPVGSDPLRALSLKQMPDGLPLQWVEGDSDGVMTCGTCHNPHVPRLGRQKLFSQQPPFPGRPGEYLTYFLRRRSQDPREGFTPLCKSCHPKL
ncbi:MAG: NapC/NirT family cytochrome c [Deltaproteobacteria bacterium]|nr:NapC/NirT family cytochrome c [Deltaproteobacteria bacterium]